MARNVFTALIVVVFSCSSSFAQIGQGALSGKVVDKASGEALPFVNLIVEQNGNLIAGAASDFNGKYTIKPIPPGKYDLKARFTGYQPVLVKGIEINADKITFKNVNMGVTTVQMETFEVIEYTVPLISKDNTSTGGTITKENINKMPGRSATSVAQTVGGVYSKDNGSGSMSIRGARENANYYYIDGIKVRGSTNLPKSAIEQVSVVTGGVPAQYGDVTGGVISITTRGASSYYFGSVEYETSGWKIGGKPIGLDSYGYNLLEYSLSGPMLMRKDSTGKKSKPRLGFFISGNFSSTLDNNPSAIGRWKIKDEAYDRITTDPLRYATTGSGTFLNAEFLRLNDFEKVKWTQNAARKGATFSGKIDVNTSSNTSLTFGGSFDFNKANLYSYSLSAQNSQHNRERLNQTWRVYSRFTQRFGNDSGEQDEKSASTIKNAFYTIQADYTKRIRRDWDATHKDNFWNYGYIGKFITYQSRDYGPGMYMTGGDTLFSMFVQQTFVDTLIGFIPDTNINPLAAQYTSSYYKLYGWNGYPNGDPTATPDYDYDLAQDPTQPDISNYYLRDFINLRTNGGLINGDAPKSVYNVWSNPATIWNGYDYLNQSQFRVSASGSADIGKNGDHAIQIGFEYEQRADREYILYPRSLWSAAEQYTNNHIINLDFTQPDTLGLMGQNPIINFPRQNASPGDYDATKEGGEAQYFFDYNLRKVLGLDPDGVDYIDFHSYSPDIMSLDYFTADELLRDGGASQLVSYYGYDHTGKLMKNDPTFDDFFTARDEYGNLTRPIGAFRPIYVAGYLQDKFAFDDLIFNIGVRVDRFDANQKVLADKYVLFPTVKAGETEALTLVGEGGHPANVQDDWIVYVDNLTNPTTVTGYRDGDTWYNAQGTEIESPDAIKTGSGIAPLLVDKSKTDSKEISSDAFVDYKPQTKFMPRIAFSFPISDEALFFAHYDILTKRPTDGIRLNPIDYYLFSVTSTKNNPNLKPEQTIDYELGFQQKLTKSSSLKLSAFYREMRNMVQIVSVDGSFPGSGLYVTYGNIDFGTVKGITFSYDLRRTNNIWLRAYYTLQFADGTGSDATSQSSLVRAGKPNLRMTNPLNYDQRHTIVTTVDYRYGKGKDYNGPVWFDKKVFENTGLNLIFNAGSGTPYSKQQSASPRGFLVGNQNGLLEGKINGARLPWQFRVDARLDRDIELTLGKKDENDEGRKPIQMNLYLEVLNVLNAKNVVSVYRATGNPDDDGYLHEAAYQSEISSNTNELAFREMYSMKINNPSNYNLPRRMRLGVLINF